MKRHFSKIIALMLAFVLAVIMPIQVFADSKAEYISEVKIGYGEKADTAKEALNGYEILSDEKGNPVDLNQNAGGGIGSKGERVVYLGYKTTTQTSEAITDLALMNMKGGYSVQDYEALMETQMKSQIIPFVENFQVVLDEYRKNYSSDNADNKQRAEYIHDALNKFTDDDCNGAGLGDLLLNKTKFEMGETAYNKLSDKKKNEHADILTIIAQSNGKATLMMENLLTRAADTNDDSWLDRLIVTEYESLLEDTELAPTKAKKELAKFYDDDANKLLDSWDEIRDSLLDYDNAVERMKSIDSSNDKKVIENFGNINENSSDEEIVGAFNGIDEAGAESLDAMKDTETIALHDYLSNTEYLDGTLLDFFTKDVEEIESDMTVLYPILASLSDGQRAGLEFVSLRQLAVMAIIKGADYKAEDIESLKELSIYDGVDRSIYEKGGVALTSDALRSNVFEGETEENPILSRWTIVSYILTGVSAAALLGSSISSFVTGAVLNEAQQKLNIFNDLIEIGETGIVKADGGFLRVKGRIVTVEEMSKMYGKRVNYYSAASAVSEYMAIGFSVAMVAFAATSAYLTYQDMRNHYKVDFTPIPHYIVDEKDLVTYNKRGEQVILKNQSAYYKVAETNRAENDELLNVIGTANDLNGTVGKQWLSLYTVKNEAEEPILASSLKAVIGDANLPAGYETGIHTFGSEAAFNLNDTQYVWNASAPAIFVYFKREAGNVTKNTGSNFTAGTLAISGSAGIVIGALGVVLANQAKKKKDNKVAVV